MADKYDIPITPQVVSKVRRQWPKALDIRAAGKCPHCKQAGLVSYQLPEDWDREASAGEEYCGYYCVNCRWGNAGRRPVAVSE